MCRVCCTGWRRLIGSPKLQIIFHKKATKYRSLLRKMTYKDKGSYESSPPCMCNERETFWRRSCCRERYLHHLLHAPLRATVPCLPAIVCTASSCISCRTTLSVCCSVFQCVVVSMVQRVAVCCSVLQCVAVCCSVLQCVAVCCSVLQCVAIVCTAS